MHIWMLGVRGSCPAPGPDFWRFGGNTSCVALAHDDGTPSLVLDAGTGIRSVANLLEGRAFSGTVMLGHLHWDHVYGLPFFGAGDRPDARVRVLIPASGVAPIDVLQRAMSPPHFPITPRELRGSWNFDDYEEGWRDVEGFRVLAREIPHKGGRTMGLRVSDDKHTIAYLSDHAPQDLGPGDDELGAIHDAALELADGADLLIHDAQYTAAELPAFATFGHAAADYAVRLGAAARVERVILFHHDPRRTDDQVEALMASLPVSDGLVVEAAVEGRRYVL
jgi:phosphoribosyl 1,2-cyclic phosphodiesterase